MGAAAGGLPGAFDVHRLLDVGGVPGGALPLRSLPLAVLLAGGVRRSGDELVRRQAGVVAGADPVVGGVLHPLGPGRLPLHLLLLPRRLLQGVLGRSALLLGRRAAQELPRRALVPADPPERPSLLPLSRAVLPGLPRLRRLAGDVVHRRRHRPGVIRDRRRHPGAADQRDPAEQLHLRLPFAPPSDRRLPGSRCRGRRRGSRPTIASAASTGAT